MQHLLPTEGLPGEKQCSTARLTEAAGKPLLLEKTPDADLLHGMIGFAAARPMEGGLTGAAWSENSPERLNQRNGYRE